MKRAIKKKSSIYQYLDNCGVLETGTNEDIEQVKKQYWKDYRSKSKKIKRHENKSFEIFFNSKESKIITQKANKYHTSSTNYIKLSALANNKNIPDRIAIGEMRELMLLHHNTLRVLVEENELPESIGNMLLSQVSQLEIKLLGFFSVFK